MGLLDALFGGKKDDSAAREMQAEEERKRVLRQRIDALYGIDSSDPLMPVDTGGKGFKLGAMVASLRNPEIQAANDERARQAADARAAMERENTTLGDATRGYYSDALERSFVKAKRNSDFALARRSLAGGSAETDANTELDTDRNLGATRISDAVHRAVNDMINQREQERLNAYGLVQSGAGEAAINAAASGLKRSFDTAQSAQKADLFGDLFATGAAGAAASNEQDQQALFAQRYRDRLNTFFAPTSSTSGRVTASG